MPSASAHLRWGGSLRVAANYLSLYDQHTHDRASSDLFCGLHHRTPSFLAIAQQVHRQPTTWERLQWTGVYPARRVRSLGVKRCKKYRPARLFERLRTVSRPIPARVCGESVAIRLRVGSSQQWSTDDEKRRNSCVGLNRHSTNTLHGTSFTEPPAFHPCVIPAIITVILYNTHHPTRTFVLRHLQPDGSAGVLAVPVRVLLRSPRVGVHPLPRRHLPA